MSDQFQESLQLQNVTPPKKKRPEPGVEEMTLNLQVPDITELKPKITVFGVGGAGGNAVNNMIKTGLNGVDFVVANTDAQALTSSSCERIIQMGVAATEGLGAGSQPEIGRAAAEEVIDEISDHLNGSHMVFITAGMGGGTGTGSAPVIARAAREMGILTVGVVTKPFQFEGQRRMRIADGGIDELQENVDTLIVIPNQNLFRIANEKTTFADAFSLADEVLYSGVACITDLMVKEGLINLDFADVRSVMRGMGRAMMGTGEASGDKRAVQAAEAAIANPLLDDDSMQGARGLLISITGGRDLTLFEVDEAASRIREEVDENANIILGATFDENLEGVIRVSVVATGIEDEIELGAADRPQPVAAKPVQPQIQRVAPPAARPQQPAAAEAAAPAQPAAPRPAEAPAAAAVSVVQRETQQPAAEAQPAARVQPAPQAARVQPAPQPEEPAAPAPLAYEAPVQAEAEQDVTIEPMQVEETAGDDYYQEHVSIDEEQFENALHEPHYEPQQFAGAGEIPQSRIPPIEEFPSPIQELVRQGHEPQDPERKPMGILRRLANVSLGKREDAPASDGYAEPQVHHGGRAEPHAAAPYQAAEGHTDQHGRQMPQPRIDEDDALEIPAFLRRQSQ